MSDALDELLCFQLKERIQDCLLELIHSSTPDRTLSRLMDAFSTQLQSTCCSLINFDVTNAKSSIIAQNNILNSSSDSEYHDHLVTLAKIIEKEPYYSINNDDSELIFPLNHGNFLYGGLIVNWPHGTSLEVPILQAICHVCPTLANILLNISLGKTRRRHDLYEERAAISRELHDSLAQSLTYLKIQATRLQAALSDTDNADKASDVLEELKKSLNYAYRQLRELMTTFRLTMHGKSFKLAVQESIDEFEKYNNIVFNLNDNCPSDILTVDEEMQILQIIREALYNIVRHSQAKHASVSIIHEKPQVVIEIEDDGIGFNFQKYQQRHHGLIIMQERAFRLKNSKFKIRGNPNQGTQINIPFTPKLA